MSKALLEAAARIVEAGAETASVDTAYRLMKRAEGVRALKDFVDDQPVELLRQLVFEGLDEHRLVPSAKLTSLLQVARVYLKVVDERAAVNEPA